MTIFSIQQSSGSVKVFLADGPNLHGKSETLRDHALTETQIEVTTTVKLREHSLIR